MSSVDEANGQVGMNNARIAVVGIALRYPDANNPDELWSNILAGRRAFRKLPDVRMRADDYYSSDRNAPDRHYTRKAAVLEGFEFDRVKYRIGGNTFRSTDMTHWLALDTAARALEDAGFPAGQGLPKESTGVIIGNTLTGEFSRANIMRLRWPYVRRTVGAALRERGWDDRELGDFLGQLEQRYKSPFPPINEDSLAGGLANTIAGRVCNYFDFGGGGFTVDGACSSSLLSVSTACNSLAAGQIDAAVVGGVDLSIDPFEVIGFAKTSALSTKEMKVYDRDSNGFWPGEGSGMLVLVRDEDAVRLGRFRYATIVGWGYSSDGKGGITRPEAQGHRRAISRAYEQAGFGFETVSYIEGHGTGTAVGDTTELEAFSEARRSADPDAPPVPIGTVKGNFGHTKAAAGVAGLIKAILAVRHQVVPPATSHYVTHPVLAGERPALRVPATAEMFPADAPVRAAVSSMGFGGINAHIVVEHADGDSRDSIDGDTLQLVRSRQDAELLLLDAASIAELRGQIARLTTLTPQLSFAELGDLAATLSGSLAGRPIRAAVVARSPEEAEERLTKLLTLLDSGARSVLNPADGLYLGSAAVLPKIAFLFPGQGAGRRGDGGALRRRFEEIDELYRRSGLPTEGDLVATEVAQPRIVTASVAGLRVLSALGIEAVTAAGHSLGELTALHWAGAMDEQTLLRTAATRGKVMAQASDGGGAMAGIAAPPDQVTPLLAGEPVVVAGYNSPTQTVISGPADAVDRVSGLAQARGLGATRINVSHAFHSQSVAPAASAFREYLGTQQFTELGRAMVSTVTGAKLPAGTDVPDLLSRQVIDPVRFSDAVAAMAVEADLFIEVGPGRILRGLAAEIAPSVPAISIEADNDSLAGLFNAVGAAFALGAPLRHEVLFRDRFTRPFSLDKEFLFLASPCESAPDGDFAVSAQGAPIQPAGPDSPDSGDSPSGTAAPSTAGEARDSLEVLRRLAAERAELPLEAVEPDSNPIDELHLSSITVGQIVNQAARELGLEGVIANTAFATSTLAEIAQALDELGQTAQSGDGARATVAGVGPWVRAFDVDLVPADPGPAAGPAGRGGWQLFAPSPHPLAQPMLDALRAADLGDGVLLCLPGEADERHVPLMLEAARAALALTGDVRFVAIGGRKGAAGLAKTLRLEAPNVATTVVILAEDLASTVDETVARISADVAATEIFSEVHYDCDGARTVPVLRALPRASREDRAVATAADALTGDDVLLVTGGGKGITAECALALGRATGASIGILGRSDPAADGELARNLERLRKASVKFHYAQADVTDQDQVRAAVDQISGTLGPVTAVLHGSGRNEPQALAQLDESSFRRTLAPKISGLEAVLAATDPGSLKLLISFASIIGRAGLRGEADYSTANDWLTDLTKRAGARNPGLRCLSLEWSVWAGAGMGERLGVLEALIRDGISPIPLEDGIAILMELLANPDTPDSVVIMGRAEGLPTITLEERELPLTRFVDRPQVHYSGVELVVDADLTAESDPYFTDHQLDGDLLFPAVLGMEAMSQAAAAVTGQAAAPTLEDVEFLRPIAFPLGGGTTIRTAVLAESPDTVRAVIRSSDTGFQADHFRATLRYPSSPEAPAPELTADPSIQLPVDPATELYGSVLFQGNRFRRLLGYRKLAARECVADISNTAPPEGWFGDFVAPDLVLADPGTRDALMHSIQCCVPDATLLPAGIEQLRLADPARVADVTQVILHARERSRNGDTYLYDLDVYDPDGSVVEQWRGLRLQAVRKQSGSGPWVPALLGPYLERNSEPALGGGLHTAIHSDDGPLDGVESRRRQTAKALTEALGQPVEVSYRPDGMPLVEGLQVTSSHGAGVTFALASHRRVACDVEPATSRSEQEWADLLGPDGLALARLLESGHGESLSLAATRVWGAVETLRKSGHATITLADASGPEADKWVVLSSGSARIASFATNLHGVTDPVVFTMLAEDGKAE